MKFPKIFSFMLAVFFAASASFVFAETKSGNTVVQNGKTTIIIQTKDKAKMPVYSITRNAKKSITSTQISDAPGNLQVDNGNYNIRVGQNKFLDPSFSIKANGQTEAWEIIPGNPMLQLAGWALFIPGITLGTVGLVYGVEVLLHPAIWYAAAGSGMACWYFSFGEAKKINIPQSNSSVEHITDYHSNRGNVTQGVYEEGFRRNTVMYSSQTFRF